MIYSSTIVYYFVNPSLTVEEIFNNCRYYDDENQWTSKRTNENLLNHIKKAKEFENQIIEQCKKYNMKYIDTSYNRESIFNELLNEIKGEYMKNIIIIGSSRVGKSTLASILCAKYNFNYMSGDSIRNAFINIYPELGYTVENTIKK